MTSYSITFTLKYASSKCILFIKSFSRMLKVLKKEKKKKTIKIHGRIFHPSPAENVLDKARSLRPGKFARCTRGSAPGIHTIHDRRGWGGWNIEESEFTTRVKGSKHGRSRFFISLCLSPPFISVRLT